MSDESKLTKAERETIILFNEEDDTAKVVTYNTRLRNKLAELAEAYPGQIVPISAPKKGEVTYLIPKACVTIRAPYSEERRNADRARARDAGRRPPCDRSADSQ